MDHVLTLIHFGQSSPELMLPQITRGISDLGGLVGTVSNLGTPSAYDIPFTSLTTTQVTDISRHILQDRPVDIFAQPQALRRKKLLVADMDATMIIGETLDELADLAGIKSQIADITARAMNGELDFADALRERINLLRGLPRSFLNKTWQQIHFTSGGRTLIQTMRANGAHCVLVSGGFKFFTEKVKEHCGFHEDRSNDFIFDAQDQLIGIKKPILGRQAKLDALQEWAKKLDLEMDSCMAVGDGANDLDMICAAGLGVAFHAKPSVANQANARINHGDLTALLFAQGYHLDEWVE